MGSLVFVTSFSDGLWFGSLVRPRPSVLHFFVRDSRSVRVLVVFFFFFFLYPPVFVRVLLSHSDVPRSQRHAECSLGGPAPPHAGCPECLRLMLLGRVCSYLATFSRRTPSAARGLISIVGFESFLFFLFICHFSDRPFPLSDFLQPARIFWTTSIHSSTWPCDVSFFVFSSPGVEGFWSTVPLGVNLYRFHPEHT